jgi:hypothetical protein
MSPIPKLLATFLLCRLLSITESGDPGLASFSLNDRREASTRRRNDNLDLCIALEGYGYFEFLDGEGTTTTPESHGLPRIHPGWRNAVFNPESKHRGCLPPVDLQLPLE